MIYHIFTHNTDEYTESYDEAVEIYNEYVTEYNSARLYKHNNEQDEQGECLMAHGSYPM